MFKIVIVLIQFLICYTTASVYYTLNTNNFKQVFDSVKPYSDLNSAYYSVKGLQLLGENVAENGDLCNFLKSKLDQNSVESVYYAYATATSIGNCVLELKDLDKLLANAVNSQNVAELYFYSLLSKHSNLKIDSVRLAKSLTDALKRDNSILNQAYSLHIATLLEGENLDKVYYDNIDDILEQADEFDQLYLQYEGGAATTSVVLDGILKLSEKHKKLTAKFDNDRLTKFVNYVTSKRHVTHVKSAFYLLELATHLTNNQFFDVVVVNRLSSISVNKANPSVLVSVTNVLGRSLNQLDFTIDASSVTNENNKKQLFQGNKPLTAKSSDKSTFELNLYDDNVQANFYTVQINFAAKTNKRVVVLNKHFDVKFLNEIDLTDLQIGAVDRDQSSPKLFKLTNGQKLNEKLEADQTSRVYIRFSVKDKARNTPVSVNQAFVRFYNSVSDGEIIFIAEQNSDKTYSCDVDLSTHAKSFSFQNGLFLVQLIVSDDLINTPKTVDLADINMKLNDQNQAYVNTKAQLYSPKPEIKHLFREPEKTPSKLVSTVFTVLAALPVLLLLLLWINLGFNVSKFQFSLSALVFHVALAGIFGLLYLYWIRLNMFVTLRYLGILSIVALVSGKKLLSNLATANSQKEKTN